MDRGERHTVSPQGLTSEELGFGTGGQDQIIVRKLGVPGLHCASLEVESTGCILHELEVVPAGECTIRIRDVFAPEHACRYLGQEGSEGEVVLAIEQRDLGPGLAKLGPGEIRCRVQPSETPSDDHDSRDAAHHNPKGMENRGSQSW
jgi:hypothetical protein